jgi:hypothetical protein
MNRHDFHHQMIALNKFLGCVTTSTLIADVPPFPRSTVPPVASPEARRWVPHNDNDIGDEAEEAAHPVAIRRNAPLPKKLFTPKICGYILVN